MDSVKVYSHYMFMALVQFDTLVNNTIDQDCIYTLQSQNRRKGVNYSLA